MDLDTASIHSGTGAFYSERIQESSNKVDLWETINEVAGDGANGVTMAQTQGPTFAEDMEDYPDKTEEEIRRARTYVLYFAENICANHF
jgi:hypothetical protein